MSQETKSFTSSDTPLSASTPITWSAADLGSFFILHRAEFVAHARRSLGQTSEAEEVVQDALVRVLLAMPELESVQHTKAYFHRTIENLVIDVLRRQGRQPRLVVLDDSFAEVEKSWIQDSDLSDDIVRADDAALIREALSFLSPAERSALLMWELEGRTTTEIALELGVKEQTVRHTVARARAALRRVLSERVVVEDLGLTARDLLSISFRKSKEVAKTSSRLALSLLLVFCAFAGFNWLSSANFVEPGTKEVDSKPVRERVQSPLNGSQLGNGKTDVVEEQELSLVSSRTQGTNFSSLLSNSAYPGLDGEGQPTGFTVADSQEGFGDLFSGQQRLTLTESGLLVSNIVSTRSGAANILINQSIVVDAFGTSYIASVSAGINGGWQALRLGFVLSEIERLPSGNYLLTAMMQVESATEGAVKVPTGNSGIDLERAPGAISTKVMLDPTKTKILAQAVFVSADSQGNGA